MGTLYYQISRLTTQWVNDINTGKQASETEPLKRPTNMRSLYLTKLMALR